MFIGHKIIKLDGQKRIGIPTRYRTVLRETSDNTLVATKGTSASPDFPYLVLYPKPRWEKVFTQIQSLPSLKPKTQQIRRHIVGSAEELELDGNGRIVLCTPHIAYAKIDKEVSLIGTGESFELWSKDIFEKYEQAMLAEEIDFSDLDEEYQKMNFS